MAAFYQRGIRGEYHVSATQFVTGDGGDLDFSGARETKMYRNQDAATYQLKAAKGQSKSSGRLILAMGILDAVAMHIATGYQTLTLATPRIPHHFCQEIADNHKLKQILIVGATEAEASEIKLRLLDAGYQGKILWTGDPTVGSKEVMRDAAFALLNLDGPAGPLRLIKDAVVLSVSRGKKRKPKSVTEKIRKAIYTHRSTGREREDQLLYHTDVNEASAFLTKSLTEDAAHVIGNISTTGTGKTRASVYNMLICRSHKYIYGAPTNGLAQEAYQTAMQMQEDMLEKGIIKHRRKLVFHAPRSEETCQRWQVIQFLQTENRAPWAQGCQIGDLAEGNKGDCPHADQCKESGYLRGLHEAKKAHIVFTVHQSLTGDSSLLTFDNRFDPPEPRKIVVDEYTPLSSIIRLKADDIAKNIIGASNRLQNRKWFSKRARAILSEEMSPESCEIEAQKAYEFHKLEYLPVIEKIYQDCQTALKNDQVTASNFDQG